MLSEVIATRYVTPLREGGSLPGIVEADDLGTYVMAVPRPALAAPGCRGSKIRRCGAVTAMP
ncbi:hypothetical protein AB0D54_05920 [Streptomyces xanthophaeus]